MSPFVPTVPGAVDVVIKRLYLDARLMCDPAQFLDRTLMSSCMLHTLAKAFTSQVNVILRSNYLTITIVIGKQRDSARATAHIVDQNVFLSLFVAAVRLWRLRLARWHLAATSRA